MCCAPLHHFTLLGDVHTHGPSSELGAIRIMSFINLFLVSINLRGNMPVHLTVRRHQVGVSLLVLALHLLAVLAWWHQVRDTQAPRKGMDFSSVAVWLPAFPELLAQPEKLADRQSARSPDASRRRDSNIEQQAVAVTDPLAFGAVAMPSAASTWAVAPTPGASALNLTLSPKALKSLATPRLAEQSPFHGRLPATIERQIASAAAESGPWTEEILDHDHVRYRRGNTCVLIERPYAAKIDPFSDSMQSLPWIEQTYPCR